MDKKIKFGLIFSGVYTGLILISLTLMYFNNVVGFVTLGVLSFPFSFLIAHWSSFFLNVAMWFGIGYFVKYLIR